MHAQMQSALGSFAVVKMQLGIKAETLIMVEDRFMLLKVDSLLSENTQLGTTYFISTYFCMDDPCETLKTNTNTLIINMKNT